MDERNKIWAEIVASIERYKKWLLIAGIGETRITQRERDFSETEIPVEELTQVQAWLCGVSDCCEAVREVWVLNPESVWEQYRIMGFTGMREQNMLEAASITLRALWKQRPRFLRKHFNEKSKKAVPSTPEEGETGEPVAQVSGGPAGV